MQNPTLRCPCTSRKPVPEMKCVNPQKGPPPLPCKRACAHIRGYSHTLERAEERPRDRGKEAPERGARTKQHGREGVHLGRVRRRALQHPAPPGLACGTPRGQTHPGPRDRWRPGLAAAPRLRTTPPTPSHQEPTSLGEPPRSPGTFPEHRLLSIPTPHRISNTRGCYSCAGLTGARVNNGIYTMIAP